VKRTSSSAAVIEPGDAALDRVDQIATVPLTSSVGLGDAAAGARRISPLRRPASTTAAHHASSSPISPACVRPSADRIAPVSVATSTSRSAPSSTA